MEFASLSGEPSMWTDANWNNCPDGQGTCSSGPGSADAYPWYHPGPVVVHISRVPDGQTVQTYDGTGEWIKMYVFWSYRSSWWSPDLPFATLATR
jgi:hypothetical protein